MSDNLSRTKRSSQAIDNFSFDEEFLVKVFELVKRNQAGTALEYFNPATEEKQDDIIAALGGSPFNFIQKDEGATYVYFGYTNGTDWKIKRKTIATGVWKVASDTGDYDTAWADRDSKTYDYV